MRPNPNAGIAAPMRLFPKIITPRKVYDLQDEFDEEYSEFEAFMARKELKIITLNRMKSTSSFCLKEIEHYADGNRSLEIL